MFDDIKDALEDFAEPDVRMKTSRLGISLIVGGLVFAGFVAAAQGGKKGYSAAAAAGLAGVAVVGAIQ